MNKKVFMIHGWDGAPEEGWRPWLTKQIEPRGFTVHNLAMPNPKYPSQSQWVDSIKQAVNIADESCFFIGHSLGCIAILRYLESLDLDRKVGGVILVAGFDDDLGVLELHDFFKTSINWSKIKSHCNTFISIESDDDPYNLLPYNDVFDKKLNAETIVAHKMKHFSGDDGITELPIVYESLLKISGTL